MANIDAYQRFTEILSWDNTPLLQAAGISYSIGFLQYFYAIKLSLQDGKGPMPFWMHSFYLAHDSIMCYVFAQAASRYNNHWFLTGTSTGMFVWTTLEIWCIHRAITKERDANFVSILGPNPSLAAVLKYSFALQLAMHSVVILGFILMGEGCFMQWFCLTNVVIVMGPTHEYLRRGSRDGLSLAFCLLNIIGTIYTFSPFGFWALSIPEVFAQPMYYGIGFTFVGYTIWCFFVVLAYQRN